MSLSGSPRIVEATLADARIRPVSWLDICAPVVSVPSGHAQRVLCLAAATGVGPHESSKLYLAAILDLFSRFIVVWAVSAVNDRHLTIKALKVALKRRCPEAGLLHHSDQGSTYASEDMAAPVASGPNPSLIKLRVLFQESQVDGGKHQDDADVHDEPFPESMPEEQHIDADDNGYLGHEVNCEQHRCRHYGSSSNRHFPLDHH
jgi:Integrase core domain